MMDYSGIVESVRQQIDAQVVDNVVIGPLPQNGGVALIMGSSTMKRYMDGGGLLQLNITINTKAREQLDALDMQGAVHAVVPKISGETDGWQITGASVKRLPVLQGQDSGGWWWYASTIEVRVYIRAEVE